MAGANVYAAVAGYVGRPDVPGAVGIFRRPVWGGEWQRVLAEREAFTVFVHPADPALVFAFTPGGV